MICLTRLSIIQIGLSDSSKSLFKLLNIHVMRDQVIRDQVLVRRQYKPEAAKPKAANPKAAKPESAKPRMPSSNMGRTKRRIALQDLSP